MIVLDKFLQNYSVNLTEKEVAVLRCLINGDTDKVIAKKVGLNVSTVRTHLIQTIFQKLGVNNRTKAALWGWYHGFRKEEHS